MSKAVLKIRNGSIFTWCHLSQNDDTAKFRYFGDKYVGPTVLKLKTAEGRAAYDAVVGTAEQFSIKEIEALTQEALPFAASEIKIDTAEAANEWSQVFSRLKELGDISPGSTTAKRKRSVPQQQNGALIPQTCLRRFYENLRFFNDSKVVAMMADYLIGENGKRASKLQLLVEESIAHFSRYTNIEEAFHGRANADWFDHYIDNESAFAKCLVARMRPNDGTPHCVKFNDAETRYVRPIDYEISPFRTTGYASFENGRTSINGTGGIDLLLQDASSGLPVIGEIKSSSDRDLLLALIQAMTYAVELTTESQFRRLMAAYPAFRSLDVSQPKCEVMVFCQSGHDHSLASQSHRLAELLLQNPLSPTAGIITRISFVDVRLYEGRTVELVEKRRFNIGLS